MEAAMGKYKIGKDVGELKARIKLLEQKSQSVGCDCKSKSSTPDGTIEYRGMAPESDDPPHPDISMKDGPAALANEAHLLDGETRAFWSGGHCYCQMLCGGQWKYFCYPSGYCIGCPGGVTVNCNGINRQLRC